MDKKDAAVVYKLEPVIAQVLVSWFVDALKLLVSKQYACWRVP